MPLLADQIVAQAYTRKEAMLLLGDKQAQTDAKEFTHARDVLEKTDELVIFSAGLLGDQDVKKLGEKVRQLLGRSIFIEIKTDPGLIGGAALVWKGWYKDYSLRSRFEKEKEKIDQICNQFIEQKRRLIAKDSLWKK